MARKLTLFPIPKKYPECLYDDPKAFGKWLAEKHLEMLRNGLQEWLDDINRKRLTT